MLMNDRIEKAVEDRQLGCMVPGSPGSKAQRILVAVAMRVLLAGLVVVLLSGCGRYKQELEEAKQRIDKLTADLKNCSEAIVGLEKDKRRLTEEHQSADAKIDAMRQQLDDLKKAKAALSDELAGLTKKNSELSAQLNSLNREKSDLVRQVDELKKQGAVSARPDPPPAAALGEGKHLPAPETTMPKAPETKSPCDAVLAFMEASEQVVRVYKGAQRTDMLAKVKEDYGPRMKGAPEKAIRNAEAWVNEICIGWDKPGDDTVFNLITRHNAVLNACKKKPGDLDRR